MKRVILQLIQNLLTADGTVVTRGSTYENKQLPKAFLEHITARYGGTRLGAQEIHAEILEETAGALWQRSSIRYQEPHQPLERVVIGVDPAMSHGPESDETGIIAVGRREGTFYVVADRSGRYRPEAWAQQVVLLYEELQAHAVVVEVNAGGEMVQHLLAQYAPHMALRTVRARTGKHVRAEPVVALYEQQRVWHIRPFRTLERQLCSYVPGRHKKSPDRLDALVWGITDLLQGPGAKRPRIWHV